jgi:DNA mismatch endonuclease, patch repair protein
MADVHTPDQRRFNMSRIRSRDTKPEIIVRKLVHAMGYRFRLHQKNLVGKPDLVLKRHRKIIFVHGCFFHMHDCASGRVVPENNGDFWRNKRMGNVERDRKNIAALKRDGWDVLCIWECMTKSRQREMLPTLVANFLDGRIKKRGLPSSH